MRNLLILCIIVSLGLFGPVTVLAQSDDLGLEIGIAGGVSLGLNESTDNEIKPLGRFMFGTTWTNGFQTEIGLGYTQNGDPDWDVDLIPIDIRLRVSPFGTEQFIPYLYAGFGALFYEVGTKPVGYPPNTNMHGWTGMIPFGVGMQYYFNEKWALDITGGDNFTFSDNLNPLNGGDDDSFLSATIGLRYVVLEANKDKDGDGLLNKEEKALGTDPKNPDTDGDGLSDGDELNIYHTDPLKADSDGDQLTDGDEVNNTKTDPNNPDTDGDKLNDFEELNTYHTDPLIVDTDADGLSDYDEIMTYKTDPNNTDTDGDKLSDGDEVLKTNSSPLLVDTDEGGIDDYDEVMRGTNPNDPVDDFPEEEMIEVDRGESVVLTGVQFASGKADITPESEPILKKALNTMIAYPMMTILIEGHTDNTGSLALNMKLSQQRADAVMNWLIDHGIDASRLEAKGMGPHNPIADNATKEGRAENRRIEFVRTDLEQE